MIGILPPDDGHKGVDVGCRLRAEVDVVGMLVHIECQDWRTTGERMAVVRRPLIDKLSIVRRPRQQNPARAAAKRLSHRHEFGSPALIRTKITRYGVPQRCSWFTLFAQSVEKLLVQNHRVHRDELLALETIDKEAWRAIVIQFGKFFLNQVQALYGTAVIVLVMADNQTL